MEATSTSAVTVESPTELMTFPTSVEIATLIRHGGRAARHDIETRVETDADVIAIGKAMLLASESSIRTVLANLLATLANPVALPLLLLGLDDEDLDVVAAVADAVGNSAYKQTLPDELRAALGDRLLTVLVDEDPACYRARSSAEYALGLLRYPPALSALIRALDDDIAMVRWNGAEALYHLRDKAAVPGLRRRLRQETDGRVRLALRVAIDAMPSTTAE